MFESAFFNFVQKSVKCQVKIFAFFESWQRGPDSATSKSLVSYQNHKSQSQIILDYSTRK